MHLVGFIIRIYHDARSPERQTHFKIESFSAVQTTLFLIIFIKYTRSNDGLFCTRPPKSPKDKNSAVADKVQHGTVLASYSAYPAVTFNVRNPRKKKSECAYYC